MSSPAISNTAPSTASLGELFPKVTVARLVVAWAVVVAFQLGGSSWLSEPISPVTAIVCFVVLFATILTAAFGVVREADHLAHQLGEPYGTLILTLSIVSIEVILIAAVMLGPGEAPTIGRDSIFAVMMIILNLVTGICLLVGGMRYGEQEYNAQGALAYISMTVLLTGTALVLPNTLSTGNGTFWPAQAIAFAAFTVVLYGAFLLMQMRGYRRLFMQPEPGSLSIPARAAPDGDTTHPKASLDTRGNTIRSITLVGMMLPIILLAHDLAILIDHGIELAGAPVALGGVLIAIIVFTPESITAVKAALRNEMQRAVNLCLGAFVSTVGLTVPAVLVVGLVTGKTVVLGITPTETVLLLLTIGLTALTFLGQRTSAVQGLMHLMLFAVFSVLLFSS
ncbi:Ca2+:H+ antiporter [Aminobacter niigataensis]|uniref:Ca2+:H+ antiporter n=1 Tax=Aminobacter niigataensis TaxID=83265 RepID=A0ABR6L5V6_9HYPH|nr:calcium:proton antiporter [Aminobacter niigataensis]MBB4652163.1 Ca2+:H+ antiporter [Aminobacter niigataensis]